MTSPPRARRACPGCGADLTGQGPLPRCPRCGVGFVPSESTARENWGQALRLVGAWLAAGGAFALWRLGKAKSRDPRERVNVFIVSLLPMGLAAWLVGWRIGRSSGKGEARDAGGGPR
jgi:hypothetical protein